MNIRDIMQIVENALSQSSLQTILNRAEELGVYMSAEEDGNNIVLYELHRETDRKGAGAEALQLLCAYADQAHKTVSLLVTGANSALHDYYSRFGFQPIDVDDETGDTGMLRQPRLAQIVEEASEGIINELARPETRDGAHHVLIDAGYRALGDGAFGVVYQKPGTSYVLKVFSATDRAYLAFVKLVMDNPNPHFPKFIGKIVKVTNDYYAIRMEPLQKWQSYNETFTRLIRGYIETGAFPNPEIIPAAVKGQEYLDQHPEFKVACDLIRGIARANPNFKVDLHGENVMQRGDTLVIIDPLADKEALKSFE